MPHETDSSPCAADQTTSTPSFEKRRRGDALRSGHRQTAAFGIRYEGMAAGDPPLPRACLEATGKMSCHRGLPSRPVSDPRTQQRSRSARRRSSSLVAALAAPAAIGVRKWSCAESRLDQTPSCGLGREWNVVERHRRSEKQIAISWNSDPARPHGVCARDLGWTPVHHCPLQTRHVRCVPTQPGRSVRAVAVSRNGGTPRGT